MAKKKSQHYVNNKEFLAAMIDYKEQVKKAETAGKERPVVSHYVGECIMKIAVHLSHKPNFINYSYRDEMICDGIENCLQYIENFNEEKSQNAFAYVTQIIYFASCSPSLSSPCLDVGSTTAPPPLISWLRR